MFSIIVIFISIPNRPDPFLWIPGKHLDTKIRLKSKFSFLLIPFLYILSLTLYTLSVIQITITWMTSHHLWKWNSMWCQRAWTMRILSDFFLLTAGKRWWGPSREVSLSAISSRRMLIKSIISNWERMTLGLSLFLNLVWFKILNSLKCYNCLRKKIKK